MGRIIIDFPENMEPHLAMDYVNCVIREGRISEAAGIKHYCWLTHFAEVQVITRRKHKGQKSDSFLVEIDT